MCGFVGFLRPGGINKDYGISAVKAMAQTLSHRGPDDSGEWLDQEAGLVFAHRRLSILDLSDAGHQPMLSPQGRYVIVFNGEIYNHLELRRDLEKLNGVFNWRGHSDTETLLAAIERWGIVETLARCIGMFAFALWDCFEKRLTLARDRFGEKPLYYGWQRDSFLFGSELKAFRVHSDFVGELDRNSLCLFFRHKYVPAPYSIYKNIYKLKPGTYVEIENVGSGKYCVGTPKEYWSLKSVAEQGLASPFCGSDHEAISALEKKLRCAIESQMVADVPLGAFLSGGVDSSTVVALMQQLSNQPIRTFSIGFPDGNYNEANYAAAVAKHLGTSHTELYVTGKEAIDVISLLPSLYDEPFSDSSQIPTYLVANLAKQNVKVALSGDGGDELFCGYERYFWGESIWHSLARIPDSLRARMGGGLNGASNAMALPFLREIGGMLLGKERYSALVEKFQKAGDVMEVTSPEDIYRRLVSHWKAPNKVVLGGEEYSTPLTQPLAWLKNGDFKERMMYLDGVTYLCDDVLAKVDRAAMGVSLETRVPLLDKRVVEFAWSLPLSLKVRGKHGKWILRQVLYKYVPRELIERKKMGFGAPIGTWLRTSLRDWAEDLLAEQRIKQAGFLNPSPIRRKWEEHLKGKQNWQYYLWDVLMFQCWLSSIERN